jgi:hypothetical protein
VSNHLIYDGAGNLWALPPGVADVCPSGIAFVEFDESGDMTLVCFDAGLERLRAAFPGTPRRDEDGYVPRKGWGPGCHPMTPRAPNGLPRNAEEKRADPPFGRLSCAYYIYPVPGAATTFWISFLACWIAKPASPPCLPSRPCRGPRTLLRACLSSQTGCAQSLDRSGLLSNSPRRRRS